VHERKPTDPLSSDDMPPTFFHARQPWTRHVAHAAFWAHIALAGVFASGWDVPGAFDEWFLVWIALLAAAGLLLPWALCRFIAPLRAAITPARLGLYEFLGVIGMLLGWGGTFGLYRVGLEYDSLVHFASCGMIAFVVLDASMRAFPRLAARRTVLLWTGFAITMIAGAANELFEWAGDRWLGTAMYGEAGQDLDTVYDFAANVAGFFIGAWAALRKQPKRSSAASPRV